MNLHILIQHEKIFLSHFSNEFSTLKSISCKCIFQVDDEVAFYQASAMTMKEFTEVELKFEAQVRTMHDNEFNNYISEKEFMFYLN